jgi:hypothetical protein
MAHLEMHKTNIAVAFRETRPGFDRLLIPFEAAFQVAPPQAEGAQLNITLRQPWAAIDSRQQFTFRFLVFLNTHQGHPQIVMRGATIRIRSNGLALLGDEFLRISGFVHKSLSSLSSFDRLTALAPLEMPNELGNTPITRLSRKNAGFIPTGGAFCLTRRLHFFTSLEPASFPAIPEANRIRYGGPYAIW